MQWAPTPTPRGLTNVPAIVIHAFSPPSGGGSIRGAGGSVVCVVSAGGVSEEGVLSSIRFSSMSFSDIAFVSEIGGGAPAMSYDRLIRAVECTVV